jgi:DNA-binding XRE family transcriptional regulator
MPIQTTISPDGRRLVTMTAEDYQDLIDARDAEAAMRAVAAGTLQTLSGGDVDAYLAAATPLAFWRKHRGFTQADMAQKIGVSQPYLAQLENGQREGSVSVYQRLAKQLGLSVDELLPDEPGVV